MPIFYLREKAALMQDPACMEQPGPGQVSLKQGAGRYGFQKRTVIVETLS